MKILLACEESQAVCMEMRKLGHEAYSCDILPCSGDHPEYHIQGDVLEQLDKGWDMMIAFPPCTYLTVTGNRWFNVDRYGDKALERIKNREDAKEFFMKLANAPIEKIAIENPIGVMSTEWRKPDQIIHPYHFGDPYQKATCLWLKNLPKLSITHIDAPLFGMEVDKGEFVEFVGEDGRVRRMAKWYNDLRGDGHNRSKTFPGIAKAMATQWGS